MTIKRTLIICGKPRIEDLKIIKTAAQKHSKEIRFWANVETAENFSACKLDNVVFKSTNLTRASAIKYKHYELKDTSFQKFISSELFLETLIISDRVHPLNLSVNNTLSYLYFVYKEVEMVFQDFKPEIVLFDNVPHDLYAIVSFNYCAQKKIDHYFLRDGQNIDNSMVYLTNKISLKEHLRIFETNGRTVQVIKEDMYKILRQRVNKETPDYMYTFGAIKKEGRIANQIREAARRVRFQAFEALTKTKWHGLTKNKAHIEQVLRTKQRELLYYLPLHFQPEATTMPYAGLFASQYIAVAEVIERLPNNALLFVKEHPSMAIKSLLNFRRYRSPLFEKYRNDERVIFVPYNFSNRQLIDGCQNIVSIAGTTLVEALGGKNIVISLVHTLFDNHPLVVTNLKKISGHSQKLDQEQFGSERYMKDFIDQMLNYEMIEFLSPANTASRDGKSRKWNVMNHLIETELRQ